MNDTTTLRCELCETAMSCETPPGKSVRYFHCARCGRWVASNYGESLMRAHTACEERPLASGHDLGRIKERMAHWMEDLDERDPYFVLGVPPSANSDTVRARFKELALENHPDRGGDPAAMRRLITAFDRIRDGKRLPDPHSVQVKATPMRAAHGSARRRGF